VLGDVALSVTPEAAHVLEAVLLPHGITVLGGGSCPSASRWSPSPGAALARAGKYRDARDTALQAARDARRMGHPATVWVKVARGFSRELVAWLIEARTLKPSTRAGKSAGEVLR
jgi:hypothetical protein